MLLKLKDSIPESWLHILGGECDKPYFDKLQQFLDLERARGAVYPPETDAFNALRFTEFIDISVVLLGQDPYPNYGDAHGLCFSVRPGTRLPGSLTNIFQELEEDIGCSPPNNGCLEPWAQQGVLLLNTVLTVRSGRPNSHQNRGWEIFTDSIIRMINRRRRPMVFVFWGSSAQMKIPLIDVRRHAIIKCAHPSMLTACDGFFGSRPFSKINKALRSFGHIEIKWQLPIL